MSSSASTWIQRKLASLPPIRTDSKRSKPGVTSSEASPFSPPSSKWLSSFSAQAPLPLHRLGTSRQAGLPVRPSTAKPT
ncbi:hypothetical protein CI109_102488 [Kwoniella shandongensis]|uniref:Uncharacterized protein n=1 Tax=Kwoniella shandongensis TaxID=1734106 RepID=A0A5M6BZK2_9TREE|nr:uncharacterized protein CI109_003194 [Kwoniella shandongensis]KAA5528296.1 hypothetical protein CI109_003194 [Kwoniella shandongensis]